MKKSSKFAAIATAVVMTAGSVLALAACDGGNGGNTTTSKTAPDPASVTGNITFWAPDKTITEKVDENDVNYYDVVAEFNKVYPNVKVTIQGKSEADAATSVVQDPTTAADVYLYASDQFNVLMKQKALSVLPEYMVNGDPNLKDTAGNVIFDGIKNRDPQSYIDAVSHAGRVWSLPATADNGYYLYYNKTMLEESDVTTLDGLLAKANTTDKRLHFDYANGFYAVSLLFPYGITFEEVLSGSPFEGDGKLTTEFTTNMVNNKTDKVASEAALNGVKSWIKYLAGDNKGKIVKGDDEALQTMLTTGTCFASISGTWNYNRFVGAWGEENIGFAKLPTFTAVDGSQKQMGSFMGGKYCGVNAYSKNLDAARAFANWVTNEKSQLTRFKIDSAGPSNKKASESAEVKENKALAALLAQNAAGGVNQGPLPSTFWDPLKTLVDGCAEGTVTEANAANEIAKTVTSILGITES